MIHVHTEVYLCKKFPPNTSESTGVYTACIQPCDDKAMKNEEFELQHYLEAYMRA